MKLSIGFFTCAKAPRYKAAIQSPTSEERRQRPQELHVEKRFWQFLFQTFYCPKFERDICLSSFQVLVVEYYYFSISHDEQPSPPKVIPTDRLLQRRQRVRKKREAHIRTINRCKYNYFAINHNEY